jgi:hypothetical protein
VWKVFCFSFLDEMGLSISRNHHSPDSLLAVNDVPITLISRRHFDLREVQGQSDLDEIRGLPAF